MSSVFFRTVVKGKINRLLMKPLNHRLVKTADQRLRDLSNLTGGLIEAGQEKLLSCHTLD